MNQRIFSNCMEGSNYLPILGRFLSHSVPGEFVILLFRPALLGRLFNVAFYQFLSQYVYFVNKILQFVGFQICIAVRIFVTDNTFYQTLNLFLSVLLEVCKIR